MGRQTRVMLMADASPATGVGHYVRSSALGEAFAARGWLVSVALPADTIDWVTNDVMSRGWAAHRLRLGVQSLVDLLGHQESMDNTVVVLDSYRVDAADMMAIRRACGQLLVLDDVAERELVADVVLNQNVNAKNLSMDVNDDALRLLGPEYVLLRQQIAHRRVDGLASLDGVPDVPRRVLVVMGGTDPTRSALVVGRGCHDAFPRADVLVVAPGKAPRQPSARITVVPRIVDMGAAILEADLVVTAAGSTLWEVCCLSRPAAAVVVAPNQAGVYSYLRDSGTVVGLGPVPARREHVSQELKRATSRPGALLEMARRASSLVDGRGAERVVNEIEQRMRGENHERQRG